MAFSKIRLQTAVARLVTVLAATVKPDVPLPVPLAPLVIEIQLTLLVAVHAHPLGVVTAVVDEVPAAAAFNDAGEIE